jgi:hypothetical protein
MVAAASLVAFAVSIHAHAETAKTHLDDPGRKFPTTRFLSDGNGGLVGWDYESRTLSRWNPEGSLIATCKPKLGPFGDGWAKVAAHRDQVMFVFSDSVVGKSDERRFVLVDIDQCEVVANGPFEIGHPIYLAAGRHDWLTVARPKAKDVDEFVFVEFDEDGRVGSRYDVRDAIADFVKKAKLDAPFGPHLADVAVAADEVWILPKAVYALLRPPQGGMPLRTVEPPECLAAKGRVRTGDDAVEGFRDEVLKKLAPEDKKACEERLKEGSRITGFEYSFGSVVTYRRYLAVTPNDPRLKGGSRLDIWDMVTESLVAVLPFEASDVLVGFSDERAWILGDDQTVRSIALPELAQPLDEPCATYSKLLEDEPPVPTPPKESKTN